MQCLEYWDVPRYKKLQVDELPNVVRPSARLFRAKKHNLKAIECDQVLLKLAYELLTNHGFKVVVDSFYTEYHLYYTKNRKASCCCKFDNHFDNQGAVNYDVHTCIFYFENSFEKGGDLQINSGRMCLRDIETINTREWNVVLLDGSTYHQVTPMLGAGRRECIVVQMKQEH